MSLLTERGLSHVGITGPKNVPAIKEKKRKSEKRKEKSRDAARSRRSRESEIFQELSEQLPISPKDLAHLDKSSLIRLTIGYLKTQNLVSSRKGVEDKTNSSSLYDSYYLPAFDGFLLIMSQDGDMIYLSENIHKYLGISQVELMGHSIFEYSHPCDHDEVREVLQGPTVDDRQGLFSLFLRMKCMISQKGKSINVRSASFRVIHCTGHILSLNVAEKPKNSPMERCLVTLGEPIPHPSNIEIPLDKQGFISRHSLDMKFTYVDQRMSDILGYKSEDIMGKSVYLFYHAQDATFLEKSFKNLFSKGQSETGRYRFLAKRGGFVWLLTQATIIYEGGSSKPQCVVCVNYVLSGQEQRHEVVSLEQVAARKMISELEEEKKKAAEIEEKEERTRKEVEEEVSLPQANTKTIFAPLTADMNKGFLTFLDDDSGRTELREEPDDLTHLAPQAGDVCFPLDMSISYPDLMEDAFLPCSLGEDSSSLSDLDCLKAGSRFSENGCSSSESDLSSSMGRNLKSPLMNDPFLCLREEDVLDCHSVLAQQNLHKISDKLLPNDLKKTRFSLGSVDISSLIYRNDNLVDVQEDCLSDCAPYIPMSDVDDFLLSSSNSLLLDSPSPLDSENSDFIDVDDTGPPPISPAQSSLAKLLRLDRTVIVSVPPSISNNNKHPRKDLHSNDTNPNERDPIKPRNKTVVQEKPQRIFVNPRNVFLRSQCEPLQKTKPPSPRKKLIENSSLDPFEPGDEFLVLTRNVNRTGVGGAVTNTFHLEVPAMSIERKQPFPTPPDPPPKRNGTQILGTLSSPKKIKLDPRLIQSKASSQGSVLLNLLVRGEDASHGYLCPVNQSDHLKYKLVSGASIADKSLNTQAKVSNASQCETRTTRRT